MVKEYMKTCLMEVITRETEIITTMKYHLILMKISIIKLSTNNKAWGEKKKSLQHCHGECNWKKLIWTTL